MDGVLRTLRKDSSAVLDLTHPDIRGTAKAKTGAGVLVEGTIVAKNANGEIVPYDPTGTGATASLAKIVGVLVHDCNTEKDDAAVIVKHGTVCKAKLLVGTAAPDADAIAALEAFGIFPL